MSLRNLRSYNSLYLYVVFYCFDLGFCLFFVVSSWWFVWGAGEDFGLVGLIPNNINSLVLFHVLNEHVRAVTWL